MDIIVAPLTDRCKNGRYQSSITMVEQKATQEAYIHAYEQHADAIFRFVYFRTRDKEDARDIVQETFLRTWRYLAEGNEIDQLRSFLFRTARNILYDMTRQHTTRNTGSLDAFLEEGGDIPAPDDGPGYDPLDIERAMKLLNDLEPPEYKEVIHLRFIEELGVHEIAAILGVSENVVSVRVSRGVAKLRKLLPV